MEHDDVNVKNNTFMIKIEDDVVSSEETKREDGTNLSKKHFRRSGGDFHAPCETTLDCQSNLICNKTAIPSFCSCEFHYQYHLSLRKCRGDPGAVCDRATAECVDNAECRDGACECVQQYIPDENKVCGKIKTFFVIIRFQMIMNFSSSVDPCPANAPYPARIRYPGNCRRFIDCQMK